jgi:hypothetical protein
MRNFGLVGSSWSRWCIRSLFISSSCNWLKNIDWISAKPSSSAGEGARINRAPYGFDSLSESGRCEVVSKKRPEVFPFPFPSHRPLHRLIDVFHSPSPHVFFDDPDAACLSQNPKVISDRTEVFAVPVGELDRRHPAGQGVHLGQDAYPRRVAQGLGERQGRLRSRVSSSLLGQPACNFALGPWSRCGFSGHRRASSSLIWTTRMP